MEELDNNAAAQMAVLGSILLEGKLMGEAMTQIRAETFTSLPCRTVWQAMAQLFNEGAPIDPITVKDKLTGMENVFGFLAQLMYSTPTTANFQQHIAAMKRESMLQQLRELGNALAATVDLDEALSLIEQGNRLSIQRQARERRSMAQMLQSFGDRHAAQVKTDFLQWPFNPLNDGVKVTGGKLVVIGGYPSDGKTAFALNAAMIQSRADRRAAFYSFETDANTVEDRVMAAAARINMAHIQDNQLTDDEWTRYAMRADMAEWPLEVIAASGMTVEDIRTDALANRYQVIYIDYLQLINPGRTRSSFSRFDEVSEISRKLQQLAKTTGITVVALSQLSRPETKSGKVPPPSMHNLRESGQIEQDADVIMLIWREDHEDIRAARCIRVAKNKEGRTGKWNMNFDGMHQRFGWDILLEDMDEARWPERNNPLQPRGADIRQESFYEISGEDKNLPF